MAASGIGGLNNGGPSRDPNAENLQDYFSG